MATTLYGDISPEVAGAVAKKLLERGMPYLVLDQFGQSQPLPGNNTQLLTFYRYNALPSDPVALIEGVTPAGRKLSRTRVQVRVAQYGDFIEITDVVQDTADDTVIEGATGALSQQAAEMSEKIIINEIKSGTNVLYAGAVAGRTSVASAFTSTDIDRAIRMLLKQNAKKQTNIVKSTPNWGTLPIRPAFIAVVPPELVSTVRGLGTNFIPSEKYGTTTPFENEIGAYNDVRFMYHSLLTPWADASTSGGSTFLSSTGSSSTADVFPVIIFGENAYANVALRGEYAITPKVRNPQPAPGDELGQRGSIGWKMMKAAKILNDAFLVRLESLAAK